MDTVNNEEISKKLSLLDEKGYLKSFKVRCDTKKDRERLTAFCEAVGLVWRTTSIGFAWPSMPIISADALVYNSKIEQCHAISIGTYYWSRSPKVSISELENLIADDPHFKKVYRRRFNKFLQGFM